MTAAIILAGGRSSRLGQPKEQVLVGGSTLLRTTVDACGDFDDVVVVGPYRDSLVTTGVKQVQESPPRGGPVAAIAAGVRALDLRDGDVAVLACDMPHVAAIVEQLGEIPAEADAVVVEDSGRLQPLAARYRVAALMDVLAGEPVEGRSMFSLLDRLRVLPRPVSPGLCADVDTPDDLTALQSRVTVADAMLTIPTVLPAAASVSDVRAFFESPHVHQALLVEGGRLVAVLERSDLAAADDGAAPAARLGALGSRCVGPDDPLVDIAERMRADGIRRLAVVDQDGRLLGLLCFNRRLDGFCRDTDVRQRRGSSST